jgi:hypothetical protein
MIVKPVGELATLCRRQRPDGGFKLFHAHGSNLTALGADCE